MDQLSTREHATGPPAAASPEDSVDPRLVEELLRALSTAVRSFRLYGGESPMLTRFVDAVRQKLHHIFDRLPLLKLHFEEDRITWEGTAVYPVGGEGAELAFLFYKDGIRELTLLGGFEDEVEAFLAVLSRAPKLKQEEDDLVTLLWEADLQGLRYEYVEAGQEAVDLPGGGAGGSGTASGSAPASVDPETVRAAAAEESPSTAVSADDFQETLYFLDDGEMRQLADEVRLEGARDLLGDVTLALYDRLEDGSVERQVRIVHLLGELLPSLLSTARFDRAAAMLQELAELASRDVVIGPAALREVRELFALLAHPATVEQLAQTLEDHPGELKGESLSALLGFFPPDALAPLMRASESVTRPDVRRALDQAIDRLVEQNRSEVVRLLGNEDGAVATAAARWVGRLGVGSAVGELTRLLGHPESSVRVAAIEALQALRAAAAGRAVAALLEDRNREVRVAAARAISALDYAPARPALERVITGKQIREVDRTEKIVFFESYGRLAGGEGVGLLNRMLNGKSWLGRGESAEMRACAALALARVRHPSAREALESAASDSDPVVRTAVARALRGEGA